MSKKKREEEAWMWITQPFVPGLISTTSSFPVDWKGSPITSFGGGFGNHHLSGQAHQGNAD